MQFEFGVVALGLSVFAGIVWAIRLESKILYLEKDQNLRKQVDSEREKAMWLKFDLLQTTLVEIRVQLAELRTRIEHESAD